MKRFFIFFGLGLLLQGLFIYLLLAFPIVGEDPVEFVAFLFYFIPLQVVSIVSPYVAVFIPIVYAALSAFVLTKIFRPQVKPTDYYMLDGEDQAILPSKHSR